MSEINRRKFINVFGSVASGVAGFFVVNSISVIEFFDKQSGELSSLKINVVNNKKIKSVNEYLEYNKQWLPQEEWLSLLNEFKHIDSNFKEIIDVTPENIVVQYSFSGGVAANLFLKKARRIYIQNQNSISANSVICDVKLTT